MKLDPQIEAMLASRPPNAPRPGQVPLAALRAMMKAVAQAAPPGPDMARVEDHVADGGAYPVPVRLYVPKEQPRAVLVYFHGGGFVLGDLDFADRTARFYADHWRCAVVSVDYRLAPEHPFPAAVEDSFAALNWVAKNSERLIGKAAPLIVGGDSAGGNLAAVMALLARDACGPQIAAQILLNPTTSPTVDPQFEDFEPPVLGRPEIVWFMDQYRARPEDSTDPRVAPSAASDLTGLPPAFVLTSEADLLRKEGEAYGLRLAQSGVLTVLRRYLGGHHSFLPQAPELAVSQRALTDIDHFLTGVVGRR